MSDYLNNLAARTLNLTQVVQPRLASLFEPVPVDTGNAERASIESDPGRKDALSESSTFDSSSVRSLGSQDKSASETMISKPSHRGIQQIISRSGNDVQQRTIDELTHGEVMRTTQRVGEPIGPSVLISEQELKGVTSLRVQPDDSHDFHGNTSVIRSDHVGDSENELRRETMSRHNEVGYIDQTSTRDSNNRNWIQPAVVEPLRGPLRSIAQAPPDRLSISSARRAFVEPPIANDLPPTINVTIGRVDVRAVISQPSAPRVSHARQSAAMSLNEYLKQRNEGHR